MIFTPIHFCTSFIALLAATRVVARPQDDGSWGFSIAPNDQITFTKYNGYFSLRPCLRDMFGNNGAAINQIAENVACDTNGCLCDLEKVESNISILSTQVPASCTDIRSADIPMATSILSGYCAGMGGSSKTIDSSTTAAPSPEPTPKPSSEVPPETSTEPPLEVPNSKIYTTTDSAGATTLVTEIVTSAAPAPPTTTRPRPSSSSTSTAIPSARPEDKGSGAASVPEKSLNNGEIAGIVSAVAGTISMAVALWLCFRRGWRFQDKPDSGEGTE